MRPRDRDDAGDAGDLVRAMRAAADHRPDPDQAPVQLRLPFTGPWRTVRTPAHRVPSHGTHAFGQSFAFDFVALDDRRRTASRSDWRTLVATEPADRFVGFDRPILAPARGRVVAVHDGEVDHEARRSPASLLRYMLTQGTRLRQGTGAVTGNCVVLELEDCPAFVLLAHLRLGSITVPPGTRVEAGEQLGTCGNSGNSTQPHLHLHAMDAASPITAHGLPIVFCGYEASPSGGGAPRPVERGVPRRREVVTSTPP